MKKEHFFQIPMLFLVCLPASSWGQGQGGEIADLTAVYNHALREDTMLAASRFNTAGRKTLLPRSRARLLPQVSFSGSNTWLHRGVNYDRPSMFIGGMAESENYEQRSWQFRLDQPLVNLSAAHSLNSAKAEATQADVDLKKAEQEMVMRTVRSYLDILRARDALDNVMAEEAALKRQLDQVKQRFDLGVLPVTDMLEAQAAYDDVVARRIQADGDQVYSATALKVITNYDFAGIGRLVADFPVQNPTPGDVSYWIDLALEDNPDIKSLQFAVKARQHSLNAVRSEWLPVLSAAGQYSESASGGTAAVFQGNEAQDRSITLSVTVPLIRSGGISSRIKEATMQYKETNQRLIGQRRLVESQVRNMYQQVRTAVDRVAVRQALIKSASSALEAVTTGYELGTRTILDVLQAQRRLNQSHFNYAVARYDYILRSLDLRRLVGLISDGDIRMLNEFITTEGEANIVRF